MTHDRYTWAGLAKRELGPSLYVITRSYEAFVMWLHKRGLNKTDALWVGSPDVLTGRWVTSETTVVVTDLPPVELEAILAAVRRAFPNVQVFTCPTLPPTEKDILDARHELVRLRIDLG